jgi:hypothetical protein
MPDIFVVPDEPFNNLRPFLVGGDGAPSYAPEGLLVLRNITVDQLARLCGLTRTAIYNYLSGADTPTAPSLHKICDALEIQFDRALEYCTPAPIGRPRHR